LTLHGRVYSFHAKQLAQTAATGIPGITRIQNDLEVVQRR
jgi:osmotically-inducible protein OsmY